MQFANFNFFFKVAEILTVVKENLKVNIIDIILKALICLEIEKNWFATF